MGEMLEVVMEAGAGTEEMVVVVEEEADLLGPAVRRPLVAEATGEAVDAVVGGRKLQAPMMVCSANL